jgi:hypothetical protein
MSGYLGVVTKVSGDGRRAQVKLGLLQITTGMLRVAHPVGLVRAVRVQDEVVVLPTGAGLEDGVVIGWFPTGDEMEDSKKIVVSNDGGLPICPADGGPLQNAVVTEVEVRKDML